jgi:hypothetical protein
MIIGMLVALYLKNAHKMARYLWSYRLEIALGVAVFTLFWIASAMPLWLSIPTWLIVFGLGVWKRKNLLPRTRELHQSAKVRRQLQRAAKDAGFGELYVDKVTSTLPGEWAKVRVPRGQTVEDLDRVSKKLRGNMKVTDVRVIPDRDNPSGAASVSIVRRDPFENIGGYEWPLLHAEQVSIRKPIPLGFDEYGRQVNMRLLGRNVILGGAPDSGKSSTLRIPAAAAALDPTAKLWMMDAKVGGAEFIHWTPAAEDVVKGRDLEAAVEMLAKLEARVEERSREIVARGEVFVCEDMELDVLMIDELPQYTRSFETDTKAEQSAVKSIREGIWRLIAMGRWAGMITILSAQKPTADIVPSESRDLIDNKFALHCNTKAMSNAILGIGAGEEAPANAASIPSGQPGVGYYVGDEGAVKTKAFFISHKQAIEVASRVAARGLDEELSTLHA